jgi:hypothetical protein
VASGKLQELFPISVVGKAVLTPYPPLRPLNHNVNPRDGAQDIEESRRAWPAASASWRSMQRRRLANGDTPQRLHGNEPAARQQISCVCNLSRPQSSNGLTGNALYGAQPTSGSVAQLGRYKFLVESYNGGSLTEQVSGLSRTQWGQRKGADAAGLARFGKQLPTWELGSTPPPPGRSPPAGRVEGRSDRHQSIT